MSFIRIIYFIIFIIIVNCSGNKVSNYHGVKSLESNFENLKVNITNKNDLLKIIGPPSIKSDFNKNKWFYIERLKTNQSIVKLGRQKLKVNNILIVYLNNYGILNKKEFFDLNNMNDLKYLNKVTEKDFSNTSVLYGAVSTLREKINSPARNRGK